MEYKLTLTLQEIQVLGQALMEIPTKLGMPLLQKLETQVQEQFKVSQETNVATPKMEVVTDEA